MFKAGWVVMFPKIVLIDNFNGCNLKCSICDHVNMTRPIKKMDFALYVKIIDEIAEKNPSARVWEIFFGDPFICNDMAERIRYAKDAGLTDVVLNTNGALMAKERSRTYVDAGLDCMYVGVDAFKKETYDKIRIGGDFNTVLKNVMDYRELTENIFVQFVETELNIDEKEDFIEFWKSIGIKVKIRPMVSWIGLVDNGKDAKQNTDTCYWYKNSMSICNDGRVALCACDIHCRFPVGSILENSIEEVWKKMQLEESDVCKTCGDWEAASAKYHV